MKTRLFISICFVLSMSALYAQQKIAYANAEYILSKLPEAKQIEAELKSFEGQLKNQLDAKVADFQQKYQEYQTNAQGMIDAIRISKEQELQDLQEQIQAFERNAQTSLLDKRNELLGPAVEKVANAIKIVAEANGYTHVFSAGAPGIDIFLYATEDTNIDLMILKQLGIDESAD